MTIIANSKKISFNSDDLANFYKNNINYVFLNNLYKNQLLSSSPNLEILLEDLNNDDMSLNDFKDKHSQTLIKSASEAFLRYRDSDKDLQRLNNTDKPEKVEKSMGRDLGLLGMVSRMKGDKFDPQILEAQVAIDLATPGVEKWEVKKNLLERMNELKSDLLEQTKTDFIRIPTIYSSPNGDVRGPLSEMMKREDLDLTHGQIDFIKHLCNQGVFAGGYAMPDQQLTNELSRVGGITPEIPNGILLKIIKSDDGKCYLTNKVNINSFIDTPLNGLDKIISASIKIDITNVGEEKFQPGLMTNPPKIEYEFEFDTKKLKGTNYAKGFEKLAKEMKKIQSKEFSQSQEKLGFGSTVISFFKKIIELVGKFFGLSKEKTKENKHETIEQKPQNEVQISDNSQFKSSEVTTSPEMQALLDGKPGKHSEKLENEKKAQQNQTAAKGA